MRGSAAARHEQTFAVSDARAVIVCGTYGPAAVRVSSKVGERVAGCDELCGGACAQGRARAVLQPIELPLPELAPLIDDVVAVAGSAQRGNFGCRYVRLAGAAEVRPAPLGWFDEVGQAGSSHVRLLST